MAGLEKREDVNDLKRGNPEQMLDEAGFKEIEIKPTFGYWSIIIAVKPWGSRG